jgi:hypothetical protein
MIVDKKSAEDSLAQVELPADFGDALLGMYCGGGYSQNSCENKYSGWQKTLHSMSFSLLEFSKGRRLSTDGGMGFGNGANLAYEKV